MTSMRSSPALVSALTSEPTLHTLMGALHNVGTYTPATSLNCQCGAHHRQSLMLSRDELVELTGLTQPKRMGAWLKERGWTFEPGKRSNDPPRVDRVYYQVRMFGVDIGAIPPEREGPRLNFLAAR